jgi:hypothetical protein
MFKLNMLRTVVQALSLKMYSPVRKKLLSVPFTDSIFNLRPLIPAHPQTHSVTCPLFAPPPLPRPPSTVNKFLPENVRGQTPGSILSIFCQVLAPL